MTFTNNICISSTWKESTTQPSVNPGMPNKNKYKLVYIYGVLNANIINHKEYIL
jgi:hypothetical protein